MSDEQCVGCGKPVREDEKRAYASDGVMHAACAKRATVQGREVNIDNSALFLEIEQLKRQMKYLERKIEALEADASDPVKHNIQIGGGG